MPDTFTRREVNLGLLAAALAAAASGPTVKAPVHLFDFAIAGGFYHDLPAMLPNLTVGTALQLAREAANPHDPFAIGVHCAGRHLGFVPRKANEPVARLMDQGVPVSATVCGLLNIHRSADGPRDLVFTGFASGDPRIRLRAG
jgi:hypothetical protein